MNAAPNAGSIRLYDAVSPDVEAGTYRITTALEIQKYDSSGNPVLSGANPVLVNHVPPSQEAYVEVLSPQFALDAGDFQGCYPPRQTVGAFGDRLPQIVLGRRTLPWERQVGTTDTTPWLALLVFKKTELTLNNNSPLFSGKISELLPWLKTSLDIADDPQITVVKVKDAATLQAVLPARGEIGLLAHVRQVNLSDTELAGTDDDGWFAVITANRFPLALPPPADAVDYVACLVSLEGRGDLWQTGTANPPAPLVVLFSWTFTSQGEQGTFEHLAKNLDAATFGAPERSEQQIVDPDGTISLLRTDQQGVRSTAAYRGPLLGLAGSAAGEAANDISLSAAWELGRLLGAADGHFIREMLQWHRSNEAQARSSISMRTLAETLTPHVASLSNGKGVERFEGRDVHHGVADLINAAPIRRANLWRAHPALREKNVALARSAKPHGLPAPWPGNAKAKRQSAGAMLLAKRLGALRPQAMAQKPLQPRFRAALRVVGDNAPLDVAGLSDYCNHALARFHLLCNIPFRYLVPDARLLPGESIRFFVLDEDWLDALASGAVEQDINSSREQARTRLVMPQAARERLRHLRLVRPVGRRSMTLRNAVVGAAEDDTVPSVVSGFLLCSSLVSGWPGLQVRAWKSDVAKNAEPTDPRIADQAITILRLERLSPTVLLALFDGIPRLVWLEEPHHGVQFGAEEDGQGNLSIPVRDAAGKDTGAMVAVRFRASPGVIDVASLAQSLTGNSSSAALALQLLRPPVRQRFSSSQPSPIPAPARHP